MAVCYCIRLKETKTSISKVSKKVDNKPVDGTKMIRIDFERNHKKITTAFKKLAAATNEIPSYDELAAETGLNRNTIYRHFKEYTFEERKQKFKALTDDVIVSLYKLSKKSAHAADIYLKRVEGISDKLNIEVSPKEQVTGFQYVIPEEIKGVEDAEIIEDEPENE